MRLLIDTRAFLWLCEGNSNLSDKARAAMEDDSNERFVSHATAWEVAIKVGLGHPIQWHPSKWGSAHGGKAGMLK